MGARFVSRRSSGCMPKSPTIRSARLWAIARFASRNFYATPSRHHQRNGSLVAGQVGSLLPRGTELARITLASHPSVRVSRGVAACRESYSISYSMSCSQRGRRLWMTTRTFPSTNGHRAVIVIRRYGVGGNSIPGLGVREIVRAPLASLGVTWRTARLLAFLYLTYGCMYLAPQARLRRWGTTTWWWLSQENEESFGEKE